MIATCSVVLFVACQAGAPVDKTGGGTCAGPLGEPIPSSELGTMTACCQADMGHAHCLANVPSEIQGFMAACPSGGYCVPDSFLETGAAVPPKQCTAFGGPGVCLSKCIPQVSSNAQLLKADVCTDPDELCVPCTNPLDGTNTHACDIAALAKCEDGSGSGSGSGSADDKCSQCPRDPSCAPVLDPSTLPSCAADAHCLDKSLVPAAEASKLGPCTDATKLCVPDKFIEAGGNYVPSTCTSVAGAEGRCLSQALPDVKKQASLLPQDSCATTEKCAPCYDPVSGQSTGACNLSCDPGPTKPAVIFAQCCGAQAHCVPTSAVPQSEQGNLSQQECTTTDLCVPDQILEAQPIPTCSGNSPFIGSYTGVCLSNCLDFGIEGIALVQGDCTGNTTCAPCTLNGQPTGAPGCP